MLSLRERVWWVDGGDYSSGRSLPNPSLSHPAGTELSFSSSLPACPCLPAVLAQFPSLSLRLSPVLCLAPSLRGQIGASVHNDTYSFLPSDVDFDKGSCSLLHHCVCWPLQRPWSRLQQWGNYKWQQKEARSASHATAIATESVKKRHWEWKGAREIVQWLNSWPCMGLTQFWFPELCQDWAS